MKRPMIAKLHDNRLANNKLKPNTGSGAKIAAVISSSADNLTRIGEMSGS